MSLWAGGTPAQWGPCPRPRCLASCGKRGAPRGSWAAGSEPAEVGPGEGSADSEATCNRRWPAEGWVASARAGGVCPHA